MPIIFNVPIHPKTLNASDCAALVQQDMIYIVNHFLHASDFNSCAHPPDFPSHLAHSIFIPTCPTPTSYKN